MSRESAFIARLAALARDPAARGLKDDVAVLPFGDRDLVLTHDMIVEGIHYLPGDPPQDVAWKLVAVNLSDLAAKGARPCGVLLGYPLAPDESWDVAFAQGLEDVCTSLDVPLLGGDTVAVPAGAPRQLGLTAIGMVEPGMAPSRAGAHAGDGLYVTGTIGAAGLGLTLARSGRDMPADWLAAYRRPTPRLAEGAMLAPRVHAMADISDGLLIDASRMARASGLHVEVDLAAIPLPIGAPSDREGRLAAATAGDDYELLFAAPEGLALLLPDGGVTVTRVGRFTPGEGLALFEGMTRISLPEKLGYEHDGEK